MADYVARALAQKALNLYDSREDLSIFENLETEIKNNTDAITIINGDETTDGSIKKTVVDEISKIVAEAPEDLDTLKEIADWIANDQTGAAELANRISHIENSYLEETEINNLISEIELYIGTLPDGSVSNNIVEYIQETINKKVDEVSKTFSDKITVLENKIEELENHMNNIFLVVSN